MNFKTNNGFFLGGSPCTLLHKCVKVEILTTLIVCRTTCLNFLQIYWLMLNNANIINSHLSVTTLSLWIMVNICWLPSFIHLLLYWWYRTDVVVHCFSLLLLVS